MPDPRTTILDSIRLLLQRRAAENGPIQMDDDLFEDVGLDSLEIAELSAMLEDDLGTDPWSAGLVPQTVGDVVGYYAS